MAVQTAGYWLWTAERLWSRLNVAATGALVITAGGGTAAGGFYFTGRVDAIPDGSGYHAHGTFYDWRPGGVIAGASAACIVSIADGQVGYVIAPANGNGASAPLQTPATL